MAGLLSNLFGNQIGYGAQPGGVAGGYGGMLNGGVNTSPTGNLSDLLTGLGVGLLSQQPSNTPISPFAGIGQGLQYANQLGQQRRATGQQQFQNQIAAQNADQQAQQFAIEKQQAEDQKATQARQQAAVAQWVQTQPQDQQALYSAYPDEAAKAYFDQQAKGPDKPITQGGLQYNTQSGQWSPIPGYVDQQAAIAAAGRSPQQGPPDIQEYQFAVGQGYKGTFQDWNAENHKRDSGLGMQGYWGVSKTTGKPVLFQLSPSGAAQQTKLPDDIDPTKPLIPVNTGTGTAMTDPITGTAQNIIPKDVAGSASAAAQGAAQGAAASNLPIATQTAQQAVNQIDDLLSPKNKDARQMATGKSSYFNFVPGTAAYDYKQKIAQLKGGVFLNAYQQLKGAGAITEVEGAKAEDALARMATAQSEDGFVQALNDYRTIIVRGLEVQKQRATAVPIMPGGNAQPGSSAADPLGLGTPQ